MINEATANDIFVYMVCLCSLFFILIDVVDDDDGVCYSLHLICLSKNA